MNQGKNRDPTMQACEDDGRGLYIPDNEPRNGRQASVHSSVMSWQYESQSQRSVRWMHEITVWCSTVPNPGSADRWPLCLVPTNLRASGRLRAELVCQRKS